MNCMWQTCAKTRCLELYCLYIVLHAPHLLSPHSTRYMYSGTHVHTRTLETVTGICWMSNVLRPILVWEWDCYQLFPYILPYMQTNKHRRMETNRALSPSMCLLVWLNTWQRRDYSPAPESLERFFVSEIEDQDESHGTPVVSRGDGAVTFLASCIPDL